MTEDELQAIDFGRNELQAIDARYEPLARMLLRVARMVPQWRSFAADDRPDAGIRVALDLACDL